MNTLQLPPTFDASLAARLNDLLSQLTREQAAELCDSIYLLVGDRRDAPTIKSFTPNEAAARLGMSRAHLCKLLDRGELAFHRVGRDRRIDFGDLVEFERRRQSDKRELAERLAKSDQTRRDAIDEIADML